MEQRYIAGDWVIDIGINPLRPVQIAQVRENFLLFKEGWGTTDLSKVKPIPLTYEMLEKNGWKWDGQDFVGACLLYPEGNYFVSDAFRTKIKYVHQLQHLLFGLGIDFDFNLEDNYENNQV